MRLIIENFAKIGSADIEVNGLTVVSGSNGSGKSTIGKLFFCLLNAVYKTKTDFKREKVRRIRSILEHTDEFTIEGFFESSKRSDMHKLAEKILSGVEITGWENELVKKYAAKIEKITGITEKDFFKAYLEKMFKYEFGYQLLNVDKMEASNLELITGGNSFVKLNIASNTEMSVTYKGYENGVPSEVFYIDTPFIMDETTFGIYHRRELKHRLTTDSDNLAQKLFNRFLSDTETDGSGDMVNIGNEASGFKTILMLKGLLARGYLTEGNLLILDEPEIHLHPDLQIILAEILITLIKTKNLNILLNTHSPYFLESVEVFARKHKIQDACNYYVTLNNGKKSYVSDTTNDLEAIYKLLAMPFEKLEKIRTDLDDSE